MLAYPAGLDGKEDGIFRKEQLYVAHIACGGNCKINLENLRWSKGI